jgi:hypothetical protein
MKLEELLALHKSICDKLVEKFSKKQDLEFEFWVADEVGEVACFILENYFSLNEMIFDLETNQPKGLIVQWQNENTEYNMLKPDNERMSISYQSYAKGFRFKDLDKKK